MSVRETLALQNELGPSKRGRNKKKEKAGWAVVRKAMIASQLFLASVTFNTVKISRKPRRTSTYGS